MEKEAALTAMQMALMKRGAAAAASSAATVAETTP